MSIRLPRPRQPDPDSGALPVIWTVSVSRLTGLLGDVIPEFDRRARIVPINLGFEEAVDVIGQRLRREHCDVVIAGGSNAAYLRSRLEVPLVPIQANGFDLMEALARARRIAPRIGLVTHASDVPSFNSFQHSFGLDIEHRRFVTREDARDCIADLRANGIEVIVGTGMAIDHAEQVGLPGVLLYSADSVRHAFEHALELTQTLARSGAAPPRRRAAAARRAERPLLLGDSAPMQQVRERIALYAPHDSTVLVTGATGTGKELVARQLHASSGRSGRFVALNCGAISESLLEAELFGYTEGAFTGARRGGRVGLVEAADGGTLFLDEIGELPLPLQTRLLRVLEEREVLRVGATEPTPVDVRVVAATLQALESLVQAQRFRRDLYYRLAALRIALPTLQERPQDVPVLLEHFFQQLGQRPSPLDEEATQRLCAYAWPGNVRELRNLVDRLRIHWPLQAGALGVAQLQTWLPELQQALPAAAGAASALPAIATRPSPTVLQQWLDDHQGNREQLAARLGVSRTTLWRWLRVTG
ncbi:MULTISPECIES: propionate catabolism operon regulatory protein PrpR [Stenotrophomonas]|uniref:propionate catabolism operon regulatory protein PrpR n=1 Tax=Stenotrophomonas sp. BIIR7 TaxID=1904462 RepID=UPI000B254EEE|nr:MULTISPECIES: propionate catabolism operon regulatory protein PrpR [Stenotrophomonas]